MHKKLVLVFTVFVCFINWSCKHENEDEKLINQIDIDLNIERFDRLFADASPEDLPQLKRAYPFMFSARFNDSIWIDRMQDTLQQQLLNQVDKVFGNFEEEAEDIRRFYQHKKFYNNVFKLPSLITVTNDVDYRNKVIVTDTIVLIALDNYLGANHEFYANLQRYLKQNFTKEQLVVDLATAYAKREIPPPSRNRFIDEMIYAGKLLYHLDVMIPFKPDQNKIGYTKEQWDWAQANESNIWRHFVENELLFDTNNDLVRRFIMPAPFSKFGLELDRESPGKLGQYIGWQIVRAYMKNNDTDFNKMLLTDSETIFNKSKFKPKK